MTISVWRNVSSAFTANAVRHGGRTKLTQVALEVDGGSEWLVVMVGVREGRASLACANGSFCKVLSSGCENTDAVDDSC